MMDEMITGQRMITSFRKGMRMATEQTMWITDDEVIFDNEADAVAHERMKRQEAAVAALNLPGAIVNTIINHPQSTLELLGLHVFRFQFKGWALGGVAIVIAANVEDAWITFREQHPQEANESTVCCDMGALNLGNCVHYWNGDY